MRHTWHDAPTLRAFVADSGSPLCFFFRLVATCAARHLDSAILISGRLCEDCKDHNPWHTCGVQLCTQPQYEIDYNVTMHTAPMSKNGEPVHHL